ncbi:hypothetical protein [Alloalcanivorax xenomutans]|uniref:hypothetical protein n=1 Tax=Alloalcanivorax xenomutans TaxID=1094342 RepID=UPI0029310A1C|nr:hypothetical protein [Alloalcanivorax xenomutans]WOA31745.1 hypothetical protein RVY87_01435 [Alloalcanivorax xenomutans]
MQNKDLVNMAPRGLTVLGLAATLTLSACGGGGGGGGGGGAPLPPKLKLSNFQPAAVVIGQADFAGIRPNQNGEPDANTLRGLYGNPAVSASGTLFISDYDNNRVLAYNGIPTANNAVADFVLGQPDFTTTAPGELNGPQQISIAGGKMAMVDYDSNRVFLYNTVPSDAGAEPDIVVGQTDPDSWNTDCDAIHVDTPETVDITGNGKLVVTDSDHNRVLIWNSLPTTHGQPADLVLGQADFTHCEPNDDDQNGVEEETPTARSLAYPAGSWTDGNRLIVVDGANNRVLIWNSFPTSNFQPADIVIGQPDFSRNIHNDDDQDGEPDEAPSARTLYYPYDGVDSNGRQLAIADSGNARVLIWNSFPTSNFQPADVVLGQSDFTHYAPNDDDQDGTLDSAASARAMAYPTGVRFYQDKLLVADEGNNRVLIFQSQEP